MSSLYITGASGSQNPRYGMSYVRGNKRRSHPHHSSEGEQYTDVDTDAHQDTDYAPEPEIQEEDEVPEADFEEEEEEVPRRSTNRSRPRVKRAAGASHNKTLKDLTDKEFREQRRINRYDLPRSPQYDDEE